ncbi:MAG TPA: hypothetical protein VLL06_05810 [Nitrospiraceae bacterium]|nr:hypothetical protein [Nitrospiraceae bacterium]
MSAQGLTQVDPQQFFRLPSTNATGAQRLDTKVSGVAVSNDFSGRLSVTTTEGDTITLSADLESDFRAVNYTSHSEGEGQAVDVRAKYAEYSLKQEFGVTIEGDLNEQEVKDLEKLFRKVANIFKQYVSGQDKEALAKTAKLAERFGHLSSLSGLDFSVDVERSVTIFAAQAASEVTNPPPRVTDQQQQTPVMTSGTATPGVAPSTVAAIPQSSTGTSAPTQPSTDAVVPTSAAATRPIAPAQNAAHPTSLVQQVLDALQASKVESHKVHKYLPDFFNKLREDLYDELRGHREQTPRTPAAGPSESSATTISSALFAYQSVNLTSISLSIRT